MSFCRVEAAMLPIWRNSYCGSRLRSSTVQEVSHRCQRRGLLTSEGRSPEGTGGQAASGTPLYHGLPPAFCRSRSSARQLPQKRSDLRSMPST